MCEYTKPLYSQHPNDCVPISLYGASPGTLSCGLHQMCDHSTLETHSARKTIHGPGMYSTTDVVVDEVARLEALPRGRFLPLHCLAVEISVSTHGVHAQLHHWLLQAAMHHKCRVTIKTGLLSRRDESYAP